MALGGGRERIRVSGRNPGDRHVDTAGCDGAAVIESPGRDDGPDRHSLRDRKPGGSASRLLAELFDGGGDCGGCDRLVFGGVAVQSHPGADTPSVPHVSHHERTGHRGRESRGLSWFRAGAKGSEEFVHFRGIHFGFHCLGVFFVAIEGFHFLGDDGEFFEFVGRFDGAAEEFPKALQQKLGIGIPNDFAINFGILTMKRLAGAAL